MNKDELKRAAYERLKEHHVQILRDLLYRARPAVENVASMKEVDLQSGVESLVAEAQHSVNMVDACNKELNSIPTPKKESA